MSREWLEAYLLAVEVARAQGFKAKVRGVLIDGRWRYVVAW